MHGGRSEWAVQRIGSCWELLPQGHHFRGTDTVVPLSSQVLRALPLTIPLTVGRPLTNGPDRLGSGALCPLGALNPDSLASYQPLPGSQAAQKSLPLRWAQLVPTHHCHHHPHVSFAHFTHDCFISALPSTPWVLVSPRMFGRRAGGAELDCRREEGILGSWGCSGEMRQAVEHGIGEQEGRGRGRPLSVPPEAQRHAGRKPKNQDLKQGQTVPCRWEVPPLRAPHSRVSSDCSLPLSPLFL